MRDEGTGMIRNEWLGSRAIPPLELWAGAECSVVRIQNAYVDQIELTGHGHLAADIDRLAGLGARAIRIPVLWERVAPDGVERADWRLADEVLGRARTLGLRPIVGLVHHGSGPHDRSLMDPGFVSGLAEYGRAVATRYPWVQDWTPVNEPVTTARFSALYGYWYPHERNAKAFARALVNECDATRATMAAIRAIIPNARLVQTEDIGTIHATHRIAHQARFENVRRFLSLDLLTGRVSEYHPLYGHLVTSGIPESVLASFEHAPCPPDVIGINYYVTSDRFLDDAVDLYPGRARGGNGRDTYADVEAVRVLGVGIRGHLGVLRLLWRRYGLPLALTEVHLGGTSDEQVRWLAEAWSASTEARAEGVDVRAVTLWAAFGSVDWDSLLLERRGHYEPGAFDVRDGQVRPTAIAVAARQLSASGVCTHPAVEVPGWWRRHDRFAYPVVGPCRCAKRPLGSMHSSPDERAPARRHDHSMGLSTLVTPWSRP